MEFRVRDLPQFDAAATLGARLDARANAPAITSRTAVRHADRSWTYRQAGAVLPLAFSRALGLKPPSSRCEKARGNTVPKR
jgi:hypothetical protein